MAKDNDFGLQSNAAPSEVTQADAVATIDRVANEPAPTSSGQSDLGVAQADGKHTDAKGLRKEFDLNDPNPEGDEPGGKPEKETEVVTDPEPDKKVEPEAKVEPEKKEVVEPDPNVEAVGEWLKDVDLPTRQDILDEFVTSNIDDLKVSLRQGGADVEMSIGELKRAASGYAGEASASRQVKEMKAEIATREKALKDREKFISDQFNDPADLMTFLDSHVTDPVQFFTAVKQHADAVLTEAEDNPARFRRDAALRRENASLRSDISEIKSMLTNGKGAGTPDAPDKSKADDDQVAEIKEEGQRRRSMVKELGFEVDAVAKAWAGAGEPDNFDHWFAKWAVSHERDTSKAKTTATKVNRQKGGAALRRRGAANPQPTKTAEDDKPLDAAGISKFLREHPTNQGRFPGG